MAGSIKQFHSDELAHMDEYTIKKIWRNIKSQIEYSQRNNKPVELIRSLEIEACYIWREIETRSKRREVFEISKK